MDWAAIGHWADWGKNRQPAAEQILFPLKKKFIHEYLESNKDAHILARSSICNSFGRHVWFIAPPDGVCITQIVE
jgi:hypothetical protein